MERLQAQCPGVYPDGQLRTLQRRLKEWRREAAHQMVFGTVTADPGLAPGDGERTLVRLCSVTRVSLAGGGSRVRTFGAPPRKIADAVETRLLVSRHLCGPKLARQNFRRSKSSASGLQGLFAGAKGIRTLSPAVKRATVLEVRHVPISGSTSTERLQSREGPRVRIRLPPAWSQVRTKGGVTL